jgi:two-component system OmpR family response regulator
MKVLVVDDHAEVLDLLLRALASDGHAVLGAANVSEARSLVAVANPDVIVLDVALPDGSGIELCRELRRTGQRAPILLLTAHSSVAERVNGLEAGADDFLGKPFALAELRARVRALGRRGPIDRPALVALGEVELDLAARNARRSSRAGPLTAREWAVLELLLAREGRLVSRVDLLDAIWGDANDAASASLDVIVARIRRKLGAEVIRTVRGEGYALGAA